MLGVMCGIDAVGYEALDDRNPTKQRPTQILENLVNIINPTGHIGLVGVYFPQDPGGIDNAAKQGSFPLPLGQLFDKGIQIGMGQTPVKRYNTFLRDLIIAGRAKPSVIVTQRLPLAAALDAYQQFDKRAEGYTQGPRFDHA